MAGFFWFSDDQWSRIEPLLPVNGKGARRVDDRRVLSGIVHALQGGGRGGITCRTSTLRKSRIVCQPVCSMP